jgi:hypothetical protein
MGESEGHNAIQKGARALVENFGEKLLTPREG